MNTGEGAGEGVDVCATWGSGVEGDQLADSGLDVEDAALHGNVWPEVCDGSVGSGVSVDEDAVGLGESGEGVW
ncbi:MAG: hypothetical protein SPI12_05845 [Actinomycetaceae bacterium]|nr:hypothetical protein [Actinomycetaceae bacterium]MDY6083360.1 hypothetical protein [Actinomycetaceae bacterium]